MNRWGLFDAYLPRGDAPGDVYNEYHRRLPPAIAQGDEGQEYLPER